jgi:hypothetical protein
MASTELRAAAKQALEALELAYAGADVITVHGKAITALRAALVEDALQRLTDVSQEIEAALVEPQRTLTDEVIADLWHQNGGFHHHFARAIERWLRGHA